MDCCRDTCKLSTPLEGSADFILECPGRGTNWYEVTNGQPSKLIKAIANDSVGTFHGLGAVNELLRKTGDVADGVEKLVKCNGTNDKPKFSYATGGSCPAQVALALYFGIPIPVLVEPRQWYAYHRRPFILRYSSDLTRVLVQFSAETFTSTIAGYCLYLKNPPLDSPDEDESLPFDGWEAYTIRPSEAKSVEQAEAWLVKRKWQSWGQ